VMPRERENDAQGGPSAGFIVHSENVQAC